MKRIKDDSIDRFAVFDQTYADAPEREASAEIECPVKRIDEPLPAVGAVGCRSLLADHGVVRKQLAEAGGDETLSFSVGLCDDVKLALRLCLQLGGSKVVEQEVSSVAGELLDFPVTVEGSILPGRHDS